VDRCYRFSVGGGVVSYVRLAVAAADLETSREVRAALEQYTFRVTATI
jgi:hypothetical protein